MIIDASKGIPIFSRQCGKTNMRMKILEAWMESYITKKPIELEFKMVKVKIDDLKEE